MVWFLTEDCYLKKSPSSTAPKYIIDLYEVDAEKMWAYLSTGQVSMKAFKAWFDIHASIELPSRDRPRGKCVIRPTPVKADENPPIEVLGLSTRTRNVLSAAGFTTISSVEIALDLRGQKVFMESTPNLGAKGVKEIVDALQSIADKQVVTKGE